MQAASPAPPAASAGMSPRRVVLVVAIADPELEERDAEERHRRKPRVQPLRLPLLELFDRRGGRGSRERRSSERSTRDNARDWRSPPARARAPASFGGSRQGHEGVLEARGSDVELFELDSGVDERRDERVGIVDETTCRSPAESTAPTPGSCGSAPARSVTFVRPPRALTSATVPSTRPVPRRGPRCGWRSPPPRRAAGSSGERHLPPRRTTRDRSSSARRAFASMPAVGSSRKSASGSPASARATASRLR